MRTLTAVAILLLGSGCVGPAMERFEDRVVSGLDELGTKLETSAGPEETQDALTAFGKLLRRSLGDFGTAMTGQWEAWSTAGGAVVSAGADVATGGIWTLVGKIAAAVASAGATVGAAVKATNSVRDGRRELLGENTVRRARANGGIPSTPPTS